jgi:Sec-independent protein secretion pathway component TatC
MYGALVIHGWSEIVGSLAIIAIIITALGTMLGLVKPADALKYCVAIVGVAIVLVMLVSVLVGIWSSMSLWQKAIVVLLGFAVWWLRRERRQPRRKKEEE